MRHEFDLQWINAAWGGSSANDPKPMRSLFADALDGGHTAHRFERVLEEGMGHAASSQSQALRRLVLCRPHRAGQAPLPAQRHWPPLARRALRAESATLAPRARSRRPKSSPMSLEAPSSHAHLPDQSSMCGFVISAPGKTQANFTQMKAKLGHCRTIQHYLIVDQKHPVI